MKRFLAIDYGTAHIGIAVATTPLAEPLESVPVDQSLTRIQDLIREYEIDEIVVGVSEGYMAQLSRDFGRELARLCHLPVEYHDETLTSRDVAHQLKQAKRTKRFGPDHHFAAANILQDYLDNIPRLWEL